MQTRNSLQRFICETPGPIQMIKRKHRHMVTIFYDNKNKTRNLTHTKIKNPFKSLTLELLKDFRNLGVILEI